MVGIDLGSQPAHIGSCIWCGHDLRTLLYCPKGAIEMTGKELLDYLRNKIKPTSEELARRKARQDAISRYNLDSKRHAQLLVQGVNVPPPVLQNYIDDPIYQWLPISPPSPPKPRPI